MTSEMEAGIPHLGLEGVRALLEDGQQGGDARPWRRG